MGEGFRASVISRSVSACFCATQIELRAARKTRTLFMAGIISEPARAISVAAAGIHKDRSSCYAIDRTHLVSPCSPYAGDVPFWTVGHQPHLRRPWPDI